MRKTNTRKTRPSRKLGILIPLILVFVASACILLARHLSVWPFADSVVTQTDKNNVQNVTANPSPKNSNVQSKADDTKTSSSTAQQATDQVPVATTMTAEITQLSQTGADVVFSMVIQNGSQGGTCVATFTNPNDRPITKQFSPIAKNSNTLCETTVSAYEFSFLGEWHTVGRYYINDQQVTAEGDVTIK